MVMAANSFREGRPFSVIPVCQMGCNVTHVNEIEVVNVVNIKAVPSAMYCVVCYCLLP